MWPLPVSELFFVGRATTKKLFSLGIKSIGELANADERVIKTHLKLPGQIIQGYARHLLLSLCETVGARLRADKVKISVVSVHYTTSEFFDGEDRFITLTTAANESMQEVHDRMPLILEQDEVEGWLCDGSRLGTFLEKKPGQLRKRMEYEQQRLAF